MNMPNERMKMMLPATNHCVPALNGTNTATMIIAMVRSMLQKALVLSFAVYHEVSVARLPPSRYSSM